MYVCMHARARHPLIRLHHGDEYKVCGGSLLYLSLAHFKVKRTKRLENCVYALKCALLILLLWMEKCLKLFHLKFILHHFTVLVK